MTFEVHLSQLRRLAPGRACTQAHARPRMGKTLPYVCTPHTHVHAHAFTPPCTPPQQHASTPAPTHAQTQDAEAETQRRQALLASDPAASMGVHDALRQVGPASHVDVCPVLLPRGWARGMQHDGMPHSNRPRSLHTPLNTWPGPRPAPAHSSTPHQPAKGRLAPSPLHLRRA